MGEALLVPAVHEEQLEEFSSLGGKGAALQPHFALEPLDALDSISKRETCIIFDWDDTLLCSSSLGSAMPKELTLLASLARKVLEEAMNLGTVMIVTNAQPTWVKESAGRFIPDLLPVLDKMDIISAREKQEYKHPGDYFAWKRETFRELFTDKSLADLNLVVLGDSFAEIQAAEYLVAGDVSGAALLKTVKFKESPSAGELIGQLQAMVLELQAVVAAARSVSTMLMQAHTRKGGWVLGDPSVIVPKEHFDEVEMLSSCLRGLQVGAWQRFQVAAAL